jgi:preprotein translocase subunit SecE
MFTVASGSDEPRGPKTGSSLPTPKVKKGRGLKGFLTDVGREMKKVSWPSRQETNRLTGVVLVVCFMLVTVLYVLGFVFGQVIDFVTKGHL